MTFMKRYITLFLLLALLIPGFAQQRDTTHLIYPIPIDNGDPVERLYNQSPLYFQDPSNITHEVIYDPITGQYTFKNTITIILSIFAIVESLCAITIQVLFFITSSIAS